MRLPLLLFFAWPGRWATAAPAPADSLRPNGPERWLAYTYANDLFFGTDYYFTQGMTLDVVHPALARLPVNRLLAAGAVGSTQHHGLLLRYDGFTPLRIQDDFVRIGDRPYAAYGYAAFYRSSTQPARRQRLTTALEIGFIGPAAGGKELQTNIHALTRNAAPRGWDYQIRNDLVLGYRVGYEKMLLAAPGTADLSGTAGASLGTLYTYGSAGLRARAGRLAPYFGRLPGAAPDGHGGHDGQPRWQCYAELTAEIRAIGYDATLQGGWLNSTSPYTLAAGAVRRAVGRGALGLVLAHAGWRFAATAEQVSPEFANGRWHRWGRLGLTRAF